ncbi:MAG TPA: DUF2798 domain-containing protein [Roseobacter sp.]|uniref:DUF2798 domain-containing protein n=1 Tax=marine sediment metagenome TaxID=412755 RepID=A0A0F9RKL7_9ZZZZ|nr:DUF2798 domain-containing protein [Roseobacter sp.]HEC71347.1 DUF2798 domain-containing protein [Roseobacter sp.]
MNKKVKIISGVIMSGVMAAALSGFFTVTKMGLVPGWQAAWGLGFVSGWPIALILSMLIARPVRALSIAIVRRRGSSGPAPLSPTVQN